MVSLAYDLHIHSCLSPCGDEDMTPWNIAGMAKVKGLDVIAVTDHNSCRNCPAVFKACEEYDLIPIAGMEICTMEEVHVLCLFKELLAALEFDRYVYDKLLPFPNNEAIFGRQLYCNENDEIIGTEPQLLISSAAISFDELFELTGQYDGIMIPAHIDKSTNSLLSNLGFIPPDSRFTCAEVKNLKKLHALQAVNPYLNQCRIISNSDAHYLGDINEPELTLLAESRKAEDILKALITPVIS